MLGSNLAQAGDTSCQVDLLQPKVNVTQIQDQITRPNSNELAVADAKLDSQKKPVNKKDKNLQHAYSQIKKNTEHKDQRTISEPTNEVADKTAKKNTKPGGFFDILLPSKLRNPVKST